MPEGDTLFHYAARIRPLLEGRPIARADSRWPARVRGLAGVTVTAVEALGKNLLVSFSDETLLRVHLGMKGSFHRYAPGERWQEPLSKMGLVLETEADTVVCFFPKALDRLRQKERATFPPLARLGPDLLREPDLDEVVRRSRALVHPEESVAFCLLDQRPACGVGNVYKNETLFLEGLSPWTPLGALDDARLRAAWATAARLMRRNIERPEADLVPRTTTETGRGPRSWVYERAGRGCLRCGGRILFENQADRLREQQRMTWWCPTCQPGPGAQ